MIRVNYMRFFSSKRLYPRNSLKQVSCINTNMNSVIEHAVIEHPYIEHPFIKAVSSTDCST